MAMIRGAPAIIRRARSVSGKSASGSQPSSTRHSILPDAAASAISNPCMPPSPGIRPISIAPTTLPRRNAGSTFAPGAICQRGDHTVADLAWVLGKVGPAGDDDHVALGELADDVGIGVAGGHGIGDTAGLILDGPPGLRRETAALLGELDDPAASLLRGVTQPQVQHRQLFFEIRSHQDDRRCVGCLVDRRPLEAEQVDLGTIAHLRVHVRRADHVVGEARPRVGVFVAATRAAENRDGAGATDGLRFGDQLGCASERRVPCRRLQLVIDADKRRTQPFGAVDRLEVEAAAIAQPSPVDRIAVDTLVAQQLVVARLHDRSAADRTRGAGALGLVEIPRTGLEPVRAWR